MAAAVIVGLVVGCAPRQDPGIPLPRSGAAAFDAADHAVASQSDALAAIDAAQRVVAENLSNAETTGYKSLRCRVQNGRPEIYPDFEQGSLESTNRDLDIAISGDGLFRVRVAPDRGDGYAYTRDGNFFRDKDGMLVVGLNDGYRLDPPISIPPDTVKTRVSADGTVRVERSSQAQPETVGQITLYRFANPERLRRVGPNLLQGTDESGPAVAGRPRESGAGETQQGFLEASNVDLNRERLRATFLEHWRAAVAR